MLPDSTFPGERFDENALFMDAYREDMSRRGTERIDRALRAVDYYASVLDEPGDPAPLPSKVDLDARIASLLRGIIDAQSLAVTLGDPRAKRLVDALSAMPGSGT